MARQNFLCLVELLLPVLIRGKKLVMAPCIEFLTAVLGPMDDGVLKKVNCNPRPAQ